jgi:hypothetical protein
MWKKKTGAIALVGIAMGGDHLHGSAGDCP